MVACTPAGGTDEPREPSSSAASEVPSGGTRGADASVPDPSDEPPAGQPSSSGGTLRIALAQDPATLDPRLLADREGETIADAVFEPLVRMDARSRLTPAAAESWTVDDAGTTFTFHLRAATFHDGTPVRARDFVRTFQRIADGRAEPRSYLDYLLADVVGSDDARELGVPLRGVEALDARTLTVRLERPQPGFLATLAHPALVPTPPLAEEDPEAFAAQPIGNGPFAMAGPREPGSFIRLVPDPDHRQTARIDEVLFTVYGEDASREAQWQDFVDEQLHVALVPVHRRDEAREEYGGSRDGYSGPGLLDGLTSGVYLYGFDTTTPPYDDPRLRRAVSLAIDREALAEEVLRGTRAPASSLVPPSVPGGQQGACDHCRHDPEAAAQLFAEVRADLGEDAVEGLTLTHSRGAIHTAIADRISSDLRATLGVEVNFRSLDLGVYVDRLYAGDLDIFRLGWEVSTPDQGAYLRPLFHSSQLDAENLTGFVDDDVDSRLDAAKYAAASQARSSLYRSAERAILDEAPVLPLLWYRHEYVVSPVVRELTISPFGRINLTEVSLEAAGD